MSHIGESKRGEGAGGLHAKDEVGPTRARV
jgi:hypothetical protein